MSSARVRAVLLAVALVALPVLGLSLAGPAQADARTTAVTSEPTCVSVTCPSASPPASPKAKPTPSESPSAAPPKATTSARPTVSPTPRRTYRPTPTASPRPRVTVSTTRSPAADPTSTTNSGSSVTNQLLVGGLTSATAEPTPVAAKVATTSAAATTSVAGRLTKDISLVVLAAVLLGLGGATGLYLTRHRHG